MKIDMLTFWYFSPRLPSVFIHISIFYTGGFVLYALFYNLLFHLIICHVLVFSFQCQHTQIYTILLFYFILFYFILFYFILPIRATLMAYGSSQARGWIGATAAGLRHSHNNMGSEPCLWPTPQLMETLDPWSTEWGQGSNLHPHGY